MSDVDSAVKWTGIAAAIATPVVVAFKTFASRISLNDLGVKFDEHIKQYNKDRLVVQQIYDVFVREGKIK